MNFLYHSRPALQVVGTNSLASDFFVHTFQNKSFTFTFLFNDVPLGVGMGGIDTTGCLLYRTGAIEPQKSQVECLDKKKIPCFFQRTCIVEHAVPMHHHAANSNEESVVLEVSLKQGFDLPKHQYFYIEIQC